MAKKDYDRAVLEFRNAARSLPASAEPVYQMALAYLASGDYRNGIASLLHTVELDPRHTGAQLKLEELRAGEEPGDIGADLVKIAERRLNGILSASTDANASQASVPTPLPDLERAFARDSKNSEVQANLIRAYLSNHRFAQAEATLDRILEQNEVRRKRASRIAYFKQLWSRIVMPSTDEENAEKDKQAPAADDSADDAKQKQIDEQRRQNHEDARLLVLRGQLYLTTVRAREAEQDLLQAVSLDSRDALAHYLLSKVHQVHGAEFARRQELTETVELDSEWLQARLELAASRTESGGADAALDLLEQAPKEQQNNLALLAARNWALLALDDRPMLRKSLDEAMRSSATPEFLLQDAYLRLRMNDPAGARKSLLAALQSGEPDLRAVDALAESYWREKNPAFALASMRNYVARYPRSAGLQYLLGTWLMRVKEVEQAQTAFRAAVQDRPGFLAALEKLADIDIAAGKLDSARQTIALIAASPGGGSASELALGVMEERPGGSEESAIAHYRKVLEENPDNITALNNLAYHLAGDLKHSDEALKLALRLKKIAPNRASVDDTLGWAYYNNGGYELAVLYLQAALAKQPKPGRGYRLAMAYFKSGAKDRARAALRDALRMDPADPEASAAKQLITN